MKQLIIIGASGHGKVIADIALKNQYDIVGFLDDNDKLTEIIGYPVLGMTKEIDRYKDDCEFVIAIGSNSIRERIANSFNVKWATLIHPSAVTGLNVQISEGTVIMANAVINPDSRIGRHCIINTGAVIEHDNIVDDFSHVSPNATLAGTVHIGKRVHIGAGAVVRNNLSICDNCVIGAGGAVVKDITEEGTYVGVPVRRLR
ncbi:MAG: acetyltransferase [Lachnospiraceae bacterium]|nr:acetyltransferase [Lachnospiraceae bacterium]